MTMLEKMARAMLEAREQTFPERARVPFDDRLTNDIWLMARAALAPLREPDDGMCGAGIATGAVSNDQYHIRKEHIETAWQAMIDHILSEERK